MAANLPSSEPLGHLCLLGLMGSGKSTVGERLARILQRPFVDLDTMITAQHGPIKQLFEQLGEAGFRVLEAEALTEILRGPLQVISPGGGAVTHERTRLQLAQTTRIYLDVSIPTLLRRLSNSATIRPLIGDKPTRERILELWHERHHWYEEAEIRVSGDATLDRVVSQILVQLKKRGAHEPLM